MVPPVNDLLPDIIKGPLLEPGIMAGSACFWANQAQPSNNASDEQTTAQRSKKRARGDFMRACYSDRGNGVEKISSSSGGDHLEKYSDHDHVKRSGIRSAGSMNGLFPV